MALRIWLPLNDDFLNQGLESAATQVKGSAAITNGSLYFGDTDGSINFSKNLFTGYTEMSVTFFAKFLSFSSTYDHLIGFFNNTSEANVKDIYKLFAFYKPTQVTSAQSFSFYCNDLGSSVRSGLISAGTLQHFALVYSNSSATLYQNGVHIGTSGFSTGVNFANIKRVIFGQASSSTTSTTKRHCNCKMSDLRIYDHALSAKEAKEISKGLILHYKLSVDDIADVATDCSGFGNDGTAVGITDSNISSDTPRYDSSIEFANNVSRYIVTPPIDKTDIQDNFTVSWWSKTNSMAGKMVWGGDSSGSRLNLYPSGSYFYWNTGNGTNNPIKNGSSSVAFAPYNDGNWHHYAMVGDGTDGKLYIDGEYKGKASTYSGLTSPQIFISGWATNRDDLRWDGHISDFRLYRTALSAGDIAELYHTPASIDNKGNFYCGELKE